MNRLLLVVGQEGIPSLVCSLNQRVVSLSLRLRAKVEAPHFGLADVEELHFYLRLLVLSLQDLDLRRRLVSQPPLDSCEVVA